MYLNRGRSRFQCLLHGTTFLILVLHLAPIFKKTGNLEKWIKEDMFLILKCKNFLINNHSYIKKPIYEYVSHGSFLGPSSGSLILPDQKSNGT